jgi:hypothetical protein
MSVSWVAGSVRARALARRRIGAVASRRLAACPSLDDALRMLAPTAYGQQVRPGQTLPQAQHGIGAAILWDLRVLAGWLPQGGLPLLRTLAAWFEIANVDELLAGMGGDQPGELYTLGSLATAWSRLRTATSRDGIRVALAASGWGDPGGDSEHAIRIGMRAHWALRAGGSDDPLRTWATAGAALLLAGERFGAGRVIAPAVLVPLRGLLGTATQAGTLEELATMMPARARWALDGVPSAASLWRAEAAWWARVERDAFALLRTSATGIPPVLGAAGVLAADAWRTRAALEIAARGGSDLRAYDAVA